MNILFSSDDNYARHLGAAIHSLLSHNADSRINIFVISNGISQTNIERLQQVVDAFDKARLHILPFSEYASTLKLDMQWPISLASYARLFVGAMLPADVSRVLYLDCDMIVCDDLQHMYRTDLGGNLLAAVQDSVPVSTKQAVGVDGDAPYFNAGMLLIDLDRWRAEGMQQQCLKFIDQHAGRVVHHDQGVLNGVVGRRWTRLPLRYNLMTIHYIFSPTQVEKYYRDPAPTYDAEEVAAAVASPGILHFTPSFTTRPWVSNCAHPRRDLYWSALTHTPWRDTPAEPDKDRWIVKLVNLWYRTFKV